MSNDERRIKGVLRDLLVRTGIPFPNDLQITEARTHITFCKQSLGPSRPEAVDALVLVAHHENVALPRRQEAEDGGQDYLRRSRLMDYDDQMVFAHRILRQFPGRMNASARSTMVRVER